MAGITKETLDSQRGSGFSFVDIAANEAGIAFADYLKNGRFTMEMIEASFAVPLVMPSVEGLPEGLSNEELAKQFGPATDARFRKQLREIEARIKALPPYRAPAAAPIYRAE